MWFSTLECWGDLCFLLFLIRVLKFIHKTLLLFIYCINNINQCVMNKLFYFEIWVIIIQVVMWTIMSTWLYDSNGDIIINFFFLLLDITGTRSSVGLINWPKYAQCRGKPWIFVHLKVSMAAKMVKISWMYSFFHQHCM